MVIEKCSFSNCIAHSGGAIATPTTTNSANNLIIRSSKFNNNHVTSTGGAILYLAKNLDMTSCTFDSNYIQLEKDGWGGGAVQIGLENENNNCKITNCIFNNNYVVPHAENNGHAGAACLRRGVTFTNCNFTNNRAYEAGALSFHDGGSVINCNFYNNKATDNGGVIVYDDTKQEITIYRSNFEKNNGKYGGVISINGGNAKIIQTKFTNNVAIEYGGALWINNTQITLNNSIFLSNSAINGSAIYNNGNLKIYNTTIENNTAKSYKLLSNSSEITKGETSEIRVYLEYGDNYPGIYNTNNVEIDDKIPTFSSGANNQLIALNISNTIYSSITNNQGIAIFKINSDKLNSGNYNFTLNHEKSTISTEITSNYTLKVNEKIPDKVIKTSKKVKKTKKVKKVKKHKKHKKKALLKKKSKKKKTAKKYTYKKKIAKKSKKKSKIILNKSLKFKSFKLQKNKKNNSFLGKLGKGYNDVKNFLNIPLFKIPNYEKTLKSWGFAGDVVGVLVDFFFGINSKGEMTVGNLLLNLLSLASGVGFFMRGAKLISSSLKLSKYLPKLSKFLQNITKFFKNNKLLQKGWNFIKNIPNSVNKSIKKFTNYITNNKYVKKFMNGFTSMITVVSNNKHVKKALKGIKKVGNYIKDLPKNIKNNKYVKKGWNLLVNTKNTLINKFNQSINTGKKYLNKGKAYLKKESKTLLYKLPKATLKYKYSWDRFYKVISLTSDVLTFVSNPGKFIISKIFKYTLKSKTNKYRKILKSKKASKIQKRKAYTESLLLNSYKTYLYNPYRAIYNVLFPKTESINKNYRNYKHFVNKNQSIKRIAKEKRSKAIKNKRHYSNNRRSTYNYKHNPLTRIRKPIGNLIGKGMNLIGKGVNFIKKRIFR